MAEKGAQAALGVQGDREHKESQGEAGVPAGGGGGGDNSSGQCQPANTWSASGRCAWGSGSEAGGGGVQAESEQIKPRRSQQLPRTRTVISGRNSRGSPTQGDLTVSEGALHITLQSSFRPREKTLLLNETGSCSPPTFLVRVRDTESWLLVVWLRGN